MDQYDLIDGTQNEHDFDASAEDAWDEDDFEDEDESDDSPEDAGGGGLLSNLSDSFSNTSSMYAGTLMGGMAGYVVGGSAGAIVGALMGARMV